jgi:hypothetical protein
VRSLVKKNVRPSGDTQPKSSCAAVLTGGPRLRDAAHVLSPFLHVTYRSQPPCAPDPSVALVMRKVSSGDIHAWPPGETPAEVVTMQLA